ncbi:group 2 grass pollen allergen [Hordeum vulgare]|nr:group 2 grass pollen allergen [Hordeum vulgare]
MTPTILLLARLIMMKPMHRGTSRLRWLVSGADLVFGRDDVVEDIALALLGLVADAVGALERFVDLDLPHAVGALVQGQPLLTLFHLHLLHAVALLVVLDLQRQLLLFRPLLHRERHRRHRAPSHGHQGRHHRRHQHPPR